MSACESEFSTKPKPDARRKHPRELPKAEPQTGHNGRSRSSLTRAAAHVEIYSGILQGGKKDPTTKTEPFTRISCESFLRKTDRVNQAVQKQARGPRSRCITAAIEDSDLFSDAVPAKLLLRCLDTTIQRKRQIPEPPKGTERRRPNRYAIPGDPWRTIVPDARTRRKSHAPVHF